MTSFVQSMLGEIRGCLDLGWRFGDCAGGFWNPDLGGQGGFSKVGGCNLKFHA